MLGRSAWQRDDVHEALRWLGTDISLFVTPLLPNVLDQLTLMSRVASAAGDAGLRARVLQSIEVLERERPGVALFAAVAQQTRGILERDADALLEAADALSPWRPLLYADAAEDAAGELARAGREPEAIENLNKAFDTFLECGALADARRVGPHCADSASNGASSPTHGQKRAGTASPTPNSRSSTSSLKGRPTAPSRNNCSSPPTQ